MVINPYSATARAILAAEVGTGASSEQVADGAAHAWDTLLRHLERIVGDAGVRMILGRSARLVSATFPCLAKAAIDRAESPGRELRTVLAGQAPDTAIEAFVALTATFQSIVARLIGDHLLTHLLSELWPEVLSPGSAERSS